MAVAFFVVVTGDGLGLAEAVLVGVVDVSGVPEAQPVSSSEQVTSSAA